jgi:integrase
MTSSLLHIIFGPATNLVTSTSPRLDLWSAAFADWLASLPARDQALNAWEQLLRFHRCPPWELDRSKLESWTSHLAETGLSANTIRCYQGRISGFYRFCSKQPELLSTEPMFSAGAKSYNPVHGALKPKERNYQHAYLLRPAEARALLRAVDRQSSLLGKRDYALLLTLLLTGLPAGQLRQLRWKQLGITPHGVHLISEPADTGKEIPPAAWGAILVYLKSSGRFDSIQSNDYVFAPLADPLLRPPSGHPQDWQADRPLSSEQMYAFLKAYTAWAGLDASKVTYACLRHTAAALRLEAGADAAGLQKFLGRKYLKDTRRYIGHLGRMLGERKPRSPRFARGSLQAARGPYRRKKPYAQPGNQNALKHGFFARRLPEIDPQDMQAAIAATLEGEIAALRVLLRRAFELAGDTDNPSDACRMLELFGRTTTRIARLLLDQKELQASALDDTLHQALAEVAKELGLAKPEG